MVSPPRAETLHLLCTHLHGGNNSEVRSPACESHSSCCRECRAEMIPLWSSVMMALAVCRIITNNSRDPLPPPLITVQYMCTPAPHHTHPILRVTIHWFQLSPAFLPLWGSTQSQRCTQGRNSHLVVMRTGRRTLVTSHHVIRSPDWGRGGICRHASEICMGGGGLDWEQASCTMMSTVHIGDGL